MKEIKTTLLTQINKAFIGRITYKPVKRSLRKDFILVKTKEEIESGYAAILLTDSNDRIANNASPMLLCHNADLQKINDGDIVSIEENGNITIIYEKNSPHNSIFVTDRCNCSCIMCPQPLAHAESDKTPLVLKLISLMDKNSEVLAITGGEPTLLDDKLISIISECKQKLPNTKLLLLTNGIKLADVEFVKKLAMVKHPSLSIDIPLYAPTDTEHNNIIGTKGFYKTIFGLYNLALFRQNVGLRVVIHKLNYARLPQLAEFIYHNLPFVSHVAFMQMETHGPAMEHIEQIWIDPFDYNNQLEIAVSYLARRGMNVSIYNGQHCVIPKTLWRYTRKSISSWKNIYLQECVGCECQDSCGGFFESSQRLHSDHIVPIKNNTEIELTNRIICDREQLRR